MGFGMVRISAIFIAVCMVLIAGSLGLVVYLRFGFTGAESALIALGVLTSLAVYNTIAARTRDRSEVSDQIVNLARGSSDLAHQVAEFGRRLNAAETKIEAAIDRALTAGQPLAEEIQELSTLVKQLAESVAAHEVALSGGRRPAASATLAAPAMPTASAASVGAPESPARSAEPIAAPAISAVPTAGVAQHESAVAAFRGLDRDGIIAAVRAAIDANRIDLFLQPIVTLPQRKVRYYEAMSRLRADNGDLVAASDFLRFAEAGGLMPKLDNLTVLRSVQVVRRLLLKNRDVGLFCNVSGATLTDSGFPQLLEFMDANRAIAPSLVLEFSQTAVRAMGPIEHESLAALAERGFRFSMDNLASLRVEPRELTERGFRFIKVPAGLLLNRLGAASTDIHPADFSDLLGRFGIDLIADRIEGESTVVDLLDYDVRFGQGFLFSPPRPVRAEALQGGAEPGAAESAGNGRRNPALFSQSPGDAAAPGRGNLASFARAGGRT